MADALPTKINLTVVTRERKIIDIEVDEVVLPASDGEIGVLPGHTPLIAALKPGTVSWRGKSGAGALTVGEGYCEVDGKDRIVVLTRSAEKA